MDIILKGEELCFVTGVSLERTGGGQDGCLLRCTAFSCKKIYLTRSLLSVYQIIITISFMQGIYTYIPETNHVPKEYSVAAVLSLLIMAPISLVPVLALVYFYISTFQSMCAVPNMAVFCSLLTSRFPGIIIIIIIILESPEHASRDVPANTRYLQYTSLNANSPICSFCHSLSIST
jgi:hypothetical protein